MCTCHQTHIMLAVYLYFSHSLFSCVLVFSDAVVFIERLLTFERWIKCSPPSLYYLIPPVFSQSFSLSLSVGYMWACLHDQRNAKSSPDHYNLPCMHNLHEIHIHSWHACTKNSFPPLFFLCFLWVFLCILADSEFKKTAKLNTAILIVSYYKKAAFLSSFSYLG